MRRLLILTMLLCGIYTAEAKIKIVDSSSRHEPEWSNGAVGEYVITSSISEISIDDAKRRAVEQIKIKVVESIAQNVNYTSFSSIEQKSGDVESFSDEFRSALLINNAKLPFISGISESKIEDYYWSISEDSKTKSRSYLYTVKYPLSHAEVAEFVRTFEQLDREKSQELEMLEESYSNIASVDQIGESIAKCEELDAYLFDGVRRAKVKSLKELYSSLYGRIAVVTKYEEVGRAYVALQIGDREIAATKMPTVRYDRDVILNLKVTPADGGFEITYDPTYCEERIPYTITLSLSVGMRRVMHEINFAKSKSEKLRIEPEGVITLTAQNVEARSLGTIQVNLDLMVEGLPANTPITVDVVTLRLPNLQDEIYCRGANANYVAEGRVALTAVAPTTIATNGEKSGSTIKLLSGEITGHYGTDRKAFNAKFTRSYRCNW